MERADIGAKDELHAARIPVAVLCDRHIHGASWGDVQGLVGTELLIGLAYVVVGLSSIQLFERLSRRGATLDRI